MGNRTGTGKKLPLYASRIEHGSDFELRPSALHGRQLRRHGPLSLCEVATGLIFRKGRDRVPSYAATSVSASSFVSASISVYHCKSS